MLKKTKEFLKRATAAVLIACAIWAAPHLKDHYFRNKVGDSVVKIIGVTGSGSGFHVEADSGEIYILTNAHVCAAADKKDQVYIKKDNRLIPRKIIAVYPKHDLCLIEKLPSQKKGLKLASFVDIGEDVVLIGHPKGRPLTLSKGEVIYSTVIQLLTNKPEQECKGEYVPPILFFAGGCVEDFQAHGISTIAFPGNSGSPVVNKYGYLVGVLFAGSDQPTDSYMVPLKYIKDFLKDY
jgi:S1-C subfamily serine protease